MLPNQTCRRSIPACLRAPRVVHRPELREGRRSPRRRRNLRAGRLLLSLGGVRAGQQHARHQFWLLQLRPDVLDKIIVCRDTHSRQRRAKHIVWMYADANLEQFHELFYESLIFGGMADE